MSDQTWPPTDPGFEQIAPGAYVKFVEGEMPAPGPDDGVFLSGKDFGVYELDPGFDKHGRTRVPFVGVDFEPLRRMAIDGTWSGDHYGVAHGLGASEGTIVPFPGGPQLYLQGDAFLVYIAIDDAPDGWLDEAMGGAGFMVAFAPLDDGRRPYILTGPLNKFEGDPVLMPPPAWRRTGRNEPCPCGSGKKYKRCHGASA